MDLRRVFPYNSENHKTAILDMINRLFSYIETQTNHAVELFYIGKTYVHKAKNRREFDTWKKEGIISRWGSHSDSLHGRDSYKGSNTSSLFPSGRVCFAIRRRVSPLLS